MKRERAGCAGVQDSNGGETEKSENGCCDAAEMKIA
jgi:hypothetical protein